MFYIYKSLLLRLSFINLDKTIGKYVKVKKEHLDEVDISRSCQRRSYPCDFTALIISFILPRPITHPPALYIPRLLWLFENFRHNYRQFRQWLNHFQQINTHNEIPFHREIDFLYSIIDLKFQLICVYVYMCIQITQ